MPDLTPAQRDLLAAVARGEVTYYPYFAGTEAHSTYGARTVTALCARLYTRGLIRLAPLTSSFTRSPRAWLLTPAGRAALESTPEAQR